MVRLALFQSAIRNPQFASLWPLPDYHGTSARPLIHGYGQGRWERFLTSNGQALGFDAAELAVVLSHYDVGVVESLTPFPRGSRQSPKVGIVAARGKFLLKRRAPRRSRLPRVEIAHLVQQRLVDAGFPAPRLMSSRSDGRSYVRLEENVYELFEFVPGHPFAHKLPEARSAGGLLARFHAATSPLVAGWRGPRGDYHDAPAIRTGLGTIGATLSSHDSYTGDAMELDESVRYLLSAYDRAAVRVAACGFTGWPEGIVHADWHPGNVLFRKEAAVAVIDYDSVRLSRRVTDVGNGALQFSMLSGGDPQEWPEHLDEALLGAFVGGYVATSPLAPEEYEAVAPLMIEALIGECVPPIAATGSVGRWSGWRVLRMIRRKVAWMEANGERVSAMIRTA